MNGKKYGLSRTAKVQAHEQQKYKPTNNKIYKLTNGKKYELTNDTKVRALYIYNYIIYNIYNIIHNSLLYF